MMPAMTSLLRGGVLGFGLLAAASIAALSQTPTNAAPPDTSGDGGDGGGIVVMSDTPQWCAHLASEVTALRQTLTGPHREADLLAQQGQRLCGAGHVRLGIMRLRYALMHLQEH